MTRFVVLGAIVAIMATSCTREVIVHQQDPAQARQDQLVREKYLALQIRLQQLRDAGMHAQATLIERAIGSTPSPGTIQVAMAEASRLIATLNSEPSYCRDPQLTSHMKNLIVACVQYGECPDVTKAEKHFASEDQYKALIQKMPRSTVFFRRGFKLRRLHKRILDKFVTEQVLTAKMGSYVFVIGRASRGGAYHRNLRYAGNRAKSVVNYLKKESNVRLDIGHTAYSGYKMYITSADELGDNVNPRMRLSQLNQSATVFLYNCPTNVREWTRMGRSMKR